MAKKRKWVDGLLIALLVGFVTVGATGGVLLIKDRRQRQEGNGAYTELAQAVVTEEAPRELPREESAEGEQKEAAPSMTFGRGSIRVDFEALQAVNPQVIGWIRTSDGILNYPVVQGTDNEYYLNHLVDGRVNRNGSIFMDHRNASDLSDKNTFIYGHNMLDGTMFATLGRYSEPGYYEAHPRLQLLMPEMEYTLQVFGGCVVSGSSPVYRMEFRDGEDFGAYLEMIRGLSEFPADTEVTAEDRIVTLSTCAYRYEDARYVLFCKVAEE